MSGGWLPDLMRRLAARTSRRSPRAPLRGAEGGGLRRASPQATSGAAGVLDDADELVGVIRCHAQATASPDPEALPRLRAEVVRAFIATQPVPARTVSRPVRRPRLRVAAFLAAAALLLLGVGGVLAAAGPGGPLYGARLDLEAMTLPSTASSAWYDAEIGRLGARVDELQAAARTDNAGAMEAAATAYESILSQTIRPAGSASPSRALPPGLERALDRHEQLLAGLLPRAPAAAKAALQAALGRLEQAADTRGHAPGPGPAGSGETGPASGEGGATPPATSRPGHAGNPPWSEKKARPSAVPDNRGTSGGVTQPDAGVAEWAGSSTVNLALARAIAPHPERSRLQASPGAGASARSAPASGAGRPSEWASVREAALVRRTTSRAVSWARHPAWRPLARQFAQVRRIASESSAVSRSPDSSRSA